MPDEGLIEVVCVPWRINRFLRFGLLVDGTEEGTLRSGKRLEVRVPAGFHSVGVTLSNRGTYEVEVEIPPGGRIKLACSADGAGLSAAQRSLLTDVWDGPSPMAMWVVDNEDWPEDPSPTGLEWWVITAQNQEAMGHSPRRFDRAFHWLTIKHYVLWGLLTAVGFTSLAISSASLNTGWLFSSIFALMALLSALVVVLRATGRRRPTDDAGHDFE